MTAFLYPGGLKLSPHPNKIRPFRCTMRAFTTQAAWLWRPVSLISLWPSAILGALCVVLFGIHHRRRKDHREKIVKLRYNLYVMDSLERKILAAFDRPGARKLSFADFGEPAAVSNAVAQLVERGWLRAAETPGTYARTEDGRLQLAGPLDVTIYSRPGCHLCEEAKAQIAPLLKEFGARLIEINIDEDAQLRARYDHDVPVIFLGTRRAAKHRVDLVQFRRQLRDNSR